MPRALRSFPRIPLGSTDAVSRSLHTGCVIGTIPWPSRSLGVLICDTGKRSHRRRKEKRGPAHTAPLGPPSPAHFSSRSAERPHRTRSVTPERCVHQSHPGPWLKCSPSPTPGSNPRRPTRNFRGRGPGPALSNKHTKRQVWEPLHKTPSKGLSHQTSREPMSLTLALASIECDFLQVTSAGTFLLQAQAEPLQMMWGTLSPSP